MPKYLDPLKPCACASGKPFADCCRPYLRGEREAPDAVSLMRARYSAFALENAPYIFRTLHPSLPERSMPEAQAITQLRRACRSFQYPGVTILDHKEDADAALVLFLASMSARGKDESFVEKSKFVREGAVWLYLSGEMRAARELEAPLSLTLATFVPAPEKDAPAQ